MREQIKDQQYDAERALYHLQNTDVEGCVFAGPADGESVLKEARNIRVKNCSFSLRYPMWHTKKFILEGSSMDELTRAALWYAVDGKISGTTFRGIKALRECSRVQIENCDIRSDEFGWKCNDILLKASIVSAEYLFLDSKRVTLDRVQMQGKYSFQYIDGLTIHDSFLDTKDAFWHSKNVTVTDSTVKGEYLAWFSENLTMINCHIIGTQPLCYCKGLKLINCTMDEADLAFEYSDVEADVRGHVLSIKNPRSGRIVVDSVGELVRDEPVMPCTGEVVLRRNAEQ